MKWFIEFTNVIYSMWTLRNSLFWALNSSSIIMLLSLLCVFFEELFIENLYIFFSFSICLKSLTLFAQGSWMKTHSQHPREERKKRRRWGLEKFYCLGKFLLHFISSIYLHRRRERQKRRKEKSQRKNFAKTNKKFLRQNIKNSPLSWASLPSLLSCCAWIHTNE